MGYCSSLSFRVFVLRKLRAVDIKEKIMTDVPTSE